jgi:tellurite resistance protein
MGETERRRSGLSRRVVSLAGLTVPPMPRFMRPTPRRFLSDPMTAISHHAALIYVMVIVSAADGEMTDAELHVIGDLTRLLPVFADYEKNLLPATAEACAELLDDDDGLETALVMIVEALPKHLKETAYAVACDVAAADGDVHQKELRLLEMIRHQVGIDRLTAAAIERAARARFATA